MSASQYDASSKASENACIFAAGVSRLRRDEVLVRLGEDVWGFAIELDGPATAEPFNARARALAHAIRER